MTVAASATSWARRQALPAARARIPLALALKQSEYDLLRLGYVPKDMDDHWFVYAEDGWVYFHRAWTGFGVYWVRFVRGSTGWHAIEAWASRETTQYTLIDTAKEAEMIKSIAAGVVAVNNSAGQGAA